VAEDTGQERTEEATPRRRQQATEKGQVARSRELSTMLVLLASVAGATFLGPGMVRDLSAVFERYLKLERDVLFDSNALPVLASQSMSDLLTMLTPFFIIVTIAAVLGSVVLGGVSFSTQALAFKWEKLDPVKGLKRVFGARGLMELLKALGKFVLIGAVAIAFLTHNLNEFFNLSAEPLQAGMAHSINLLLWSFLIMSGALVVIALIDVPFQLWDHSRQLRMTRQEVKDDSKETEGNPEMRGQVRRMQREIAQRRMMEEVPKADVVITNPEHYSVALRYDQKTMRAPVVLAKGADHIALRIREVAKQHDVVILSAPPLARALYHTTELEKEIPAGLYLAVAQVLAYVFQLKQRSAAERNNPRDFGDLPIPKDMQFDK
jgi:flagellar biosynthetic protein FlhB